MNKEMTSLVNVIIQNQTEDAMWLKLVELVVEKLKKIQIICFLLAMS